MIAKRVAAVAAAAALILGAIVLRDRVIDGDSDRPAAADRELICASELASVCRAVAGPSLSVRVEDAGTTLDDLASADASGDAIWLTFEPFPAMLDALRGSSGMPGLDVSTVQLASSPIALVADADDADNLIASCGESVSWRCVGESGLATGFARAPQSGTGLLGVAQAALGYSSIGQVPVGDALFQIWLRSVITSVTANQLSGGTAIATIRTRPSSMDVAVGALAELGDPEVSGLVVEYAEPMIRADVVLAVPGGGSAPAGLADELADALLATGWSGPAAAPNPLPDPAIMIALRELWKGFA